MIKLKINGAFSAELRLSFFFGIKMIASRSSGEDFPPFSEP